MDLNDPQKRGAVVNALIDDLNSDHMRVFAEFIEDYEKFKNKVPALCDKETLKKEFEEFMQTMFECQKRLGSKFSILRVYEALPVNQWIPIMRYINEVRRKVCEKANPNEDPDKIPLEEREEIFVLAEKYLSGVDVN
jgi:hypothetical protein